MGRTRAGAAYGQNSFSRRVGVFRAVGGGHGGKRPGAGGDRGRHGHAHPASGLRPAQPRRDGELRGNPAQRHDQSDRLSEAHPGAHGLAQRFRDQRLQHAGRERSFVAGRPEPPRPAQSGLCAYAGPGRQSPHRQRVHRQRCRRHRLHSDLARRSCRRVDGRRIGRLRRGRRVGRRQLRDEARSRGHSCQGPVRHGFRRRRQQDDREPRGRTQFRRRQGQHLDRV